MATSLAIACLRLQDDAAAGVPWWRALWEQPGVLEGMLVLGLAVVGAITVLRLRRFAGDAARRHELADYLIGAEQALHGAAAAAARRLGKVVALDPENAHARLLLASALLELGEPESAHKQHVILQTAFGVDSAANDAALGRALLAAGEPAAARAALTRAVAAMPRNRGAWEALFAACLQDGDAAAALTAGRRAAALPANARGNAELQRRLAACAGPGAGEGRVGGAHVPACAWTCRRCGLGADARFHACPTCAAVGHCEPTEPALVAALADVGAVQAEIAGDRTHLASLVERLRDDDEPASRQARADLLAMGARAVAAILDGLGAEAAATDERLVTTIAAGGDAVVPALVEEFGAGAWLERVAFGLLARASNRRLRIVEALAAIDTPTAHAALQRLAHDERDPRLLAWIRQAMTRQLPHAGGEP